MSSAQDFDEAKAAARRAGSVTGYAVFAAFNVADRTAEVHALRLDEPVSAADKLEARGKGVALWRLEERQSRIGGLSGDSLRKGVDRG
jgi:hypothetical protein